MLLTLGHWAVALETGVSAGALSTLLIVLGRATKPWVISTVIGIATTIADFFVHSGDLGKVLREAVLTGLGAAILSTLLLTVIRCVVRRRHS